MAKPAVGTGFGTLYISTNTIHGYVNKISGATSYIIYYRPSSSSTATAVTAGSNGYFFITGLSSGTEYVINYRGVNSDGEGNTMATGKTFVAKNDRSSWTLYSSSASWGNISSGGTKQIAYLTDDCYLYRYSMTFAASGTVTFEFENNFSVIAYLSTTTSHSSGSPSSNIASKSGTSFTMTASVTAGTTYYLYFRGNNGRPYIGMVDIYMSAPTASKPSTGTISSVSSTATTIKVVGASISNADSYQFAITLGQSTTTYTQSSYTYTFKSLSPGTQYSVKYRGVNSAYNGSYSTSKTVWTLPSDTTMVSAQSVSTTQIKVTWAACSGATRYSIYYCIDGTSSGKTLNSVSYTTNSDGSMSYTITGLEEQTKYYIYCTSYNSNGDPCEIADYIYGTTQSSVKGCGYIYTSNGWSKATPYIYTSSGWQVAIPYVYTSSGWKQAGG